MHWFLFFSFFFLFLLKKILKQRHHRSCLLRVQWSACDRWARGGRDRRPRRGASSCLVARFITLPNVARSRGVVGLATVLAYHTGGARGCPGVSRYWGDGYDSRDEWHNRRHCLQVLRSHQPATADD